MSFKTRRVYDTITRYLHDTSGYIFYFRTAVDIHFLGVKTGGIKNLPALPPGDLEEMMSNLTGKLLSHTRRTRNITTGPSSSSHVHATRRTPTIRLS